MNPNVEQAERQLGDLQQVEGRWQLRFVRRLQHPPEKVWRALTEPEHLAVWFPSTVEGERTAGAKLRFTFPFDDAPVMDGEMVVYEPPSVLEFTWGEGDLLRFELQPDDDGTVLTLLDRFDEQGRAARDGAGWHASLDVLTYHLAGEPTPWPPDERWSHVNQLYIEHLGPEASTIGPPNWHPEG
ncbi:MAG TPA: SRPBCC family protein [Acidimicrobiales bacterium]